ncbi:MULTISPECIES: DUF2155 domain-containing protein [unclassified Brevundimonas]|uniref:DUF2155 domain-containing protein n=1 Tax=unclassified Brevundimonas TaxID=2622653 RepID=UPI0025B7A7DF|nr:MULTISPECIES: DUF2155 domain-containing protein [unclassified Brevundimonas]
MSFRGALLGGMIAVGVGLSGAGVTAALMDVPQDAVPASQDPVGDALRAAQQQQTPPQTPAQPAQPSAQDIPAGSTGITVVDPVAATPQEEVPAEELVEEEAVEGAPPAAETVEPTVRRRHRVALIQAIDKTTAETMQFEVEVGGRPVRFAKSLIFKVRACEVTGPNELTEDAIAYVEAGIQPRAERASTEARQIFKGWMFASSPSLNGLEHPVYDAWVVGCK